jgi:hypothetical protein
VKGIVGESASLCVIRIGVFEYQVLVSGLRSGVGGTFEWRVDPFGECRFLLVDVSLGDNVHSRPVPLD